MNRHKFSIKVIITLAALAFFTASSSYASDLNSNAHVKKTVFTIHRGINIAHWTSQSSTRGKERAEIFTEPDVKQLAGWGFDHLRLPVDEEQLFHEDGTIDEETMTLVENAIKWCKKYGMKVIFDFHILRSHNFDEKVKSLWTSEAAQQRMRDMWSIIAKRLDKYPVKLLAFELMNEPVAPENEDWNKITEKLIPVLRKVNKQRIIVVASNKWNSVYNIPDVKVPEGDPNIILSFHFYEPFILTHYQASWTNQKSLNVKGGINYPGNPCSQEIFDQLSQNDKEIMKSWYQKTFNKEWILSSWQKAIDYAKQKGLTLYLGEFGCLPNCGENSRLAWVNDIVSLSNEYNIPHAYWEYKSEFGFANWTDRKLNNPQLLKILVK